MSSFALAVAGFSLQASFLESHAQEMPPSAKESGGKHFFEKKNLSKEEKDFWWKNTKTDDEGFLTFRGTEKEVGLISQAIAAPILKKEAPVEFQSIVKYFVDEGFPFGGYIAEGNERHTFVFGNKSSGYLMYTRFAYEKANSTITLIDGFARQKVKDRPAVLTLTIDPGGINALWKLTTWREGVEHELYVSDTLDKRGRPIRRPQSVVRLGDMLED